MCYRYCKGSDQYAGREGELLVKDARLVEPAQFSVFRSLRGHGMDMLPGLQCSYRLSQSSS